MCKYGFYPLVSYQIIFMIYCSALPGKSLRESSREFWDTLKMMWFPQTLLVTAGEFVYSFTSFHLRANMWIYSWVVRLIRMDLSSLYVDILLCETEQTI